MDGRNLDKLFNRNCDVVISPMNTIDYAPCFADRECMLINMYKCLRVGGIFAFVSRQIGACTFSPKLSLKAKSIKNIFVKDIVKRTEYVTPISEVYMSTEKFTLNYMQNLLNLKQPKIFCDKRGIIESKMSKNRILRKIWYLLCVCIHKILINFVYSFKGNKFYKIFNHH